MRYLYMSIVFCVACNAPAQTGNESTHPIQDTIVVDSNNVFQSPILKKTIPDSADEHFLTIYAELRSSIQTTRLKLYQKYLTSTTETQQRAVLDSCQLFLQEALVNNVFPFWYGTAWDFNGISNEPQHGQIACGYFVSTTLKHCGFNLNRYKIAQQYSHSIVKTLCTDVQRLTSFEQLISYISLQPNQLYVIGLDNHVGFISMSNGKITFIHSTFVDEAVVITEIAKESLVLKNSNLYILGNLSGNDALLLSWLSKDPIAIRY